MIDFDADLLDMLDTEEFATTITLLITPNVTVKGIFDSEHLEISTDGITEVSSFSPVVEIRTIDENGILQDDQLSIGSTTFIVTDLQRDGLGMTRLLLHEV